MEKIKLKNAELWIEDDICIGKIWGEPDEELVKEFAKRAEELLKKIPGKKYSLIDISDVRKATLGARKATQNLPLVSEKIALVYKNPLAKVIGSFFLRIIKLKAPIKLFATIEEAKKWFKEK